jgi:hypothetical protein
MVDLLSCIMKKPLESSVLVDCGHPKGAVALAAAGVSNDVDSCPLLADEYARLSGPSKCSIQARKSVVACFLAKFTEVL